MLTTVVNTMSQWNDAQWVLFGLAWLFVIGVFIFAHFVIAGVPGQVRSLYKDEEDDSDSPFDNSMLPTHAEYNHQVTLASRRASVMPRYARQLQATPFAAPLFADEQEVRRQRAIAKLQRQRESKSPDGSFERPYVSGYLRWPLRSLEEVQGLRLAKLNR